MMKDRCMARVRDATSNEQTIAWPYRWVTLLLFSAFFIALATFPALAETRTASFFSVWEGKGFLYKTGEETTTFVGAFEGPVYVETEEGPIEGGRLACPGKLEINVRTARQSGEGSCQFVTNEGSIAFADWSCHGVYMVGCRGSMTITSGIGRFKGANGSGDFTIRGSLRDAAISQGGGGVEADLHGIVFWKDFTYEVPD